MPVLLMMAGLFLDLGYSYAQKRFVQNAADAGAIRGAQMLVQKSFTTATDQATSFAGLSMPAPNSSHTISVKYSDKQDAKSSDTTAWYTTPTYNTLTVWVHVEQNQPTFLMRIFGWNALSEWADARVSIFAASPNQTPQLNALPFCINKPYVLAHQSITDTFYIWQPSGAAEKQDSGARHALGEPTNFKGFCDLNGSPNAQTSDLSNWVANGYGGSLKIGDSIPLDTGATASAGASPLQTYITNHAQTDTGGTFAIITIPYYDYGGYDVTTNKITIAGFLQVKVYYNDVSSNTALGSFVRFTSDGTPSPGTTVTSYGEITLKLMN